jgi:hypothetical protein
VRSDGCQGGGGIGVRHRTTHDFAAGGDQAVDLGAGRANVAGVGAGHGLHRHRRTAPDGNGSDMDLAGLMIHGTEFTLSSGIVEAQHAVK